MPAPERTDADFIGVEGTTWRHLRIEERVGRGGRGSVFRAYDPLLNLRVALKLNSKPSPEDVRSGDNTSSALLEARRLSRVEHPHVVRIHGVEQVDETVGLWMDLIEGRTLDWIVTHDGPMGDSEALLAGRSLAGALAAVHQAGLVHGDVKAQNVMRETGGRIVLMDFGACRPTPLVDVPDGPIQGSPFYAAPEVLRGDAPDARSDLYSLGVLLFYLVSGEYPYRARTLAELSACHASDGRLHLSDTRPDMPASFARLVDRLLSIDPTLRPESAGAVESEMATLLGAGRSAAPTVKFDAHEQNVVTGGRRKAWLIGTAAGIALVAAAAGFLLLHGRFDIEGRLLLLESNGSEVLTNGSAVHVDDRLVFRLRSSKSLHVYVFNQDDHGVVSVLFPRPGLELRNPLPGRQEIQLPGQFEGVPQGWTVSTVGGHEDIVIVATAEPDPRLEAVAAELPGASLDDAGAASALSPIFRSIGKLTSLRVDAPGESAGNSRRLADLVRDFRPGREQARGHWIRVIRLRNEGAERPR